MATVNFLISKNAKSPIYCRLGAGVGLNLKRSTGLYVYAEHWNQKTQSIKNVIAVPNRDEINSKLSKLKIFILDEFNLAYSDGIIITSDWLDKSIKKFFNRPKDEVKLRNQPHQIYLSDFADWWAINKAPTWKVSSGKFLDDKSIGQYKLFIRILKSFEKAKKVVLREISEELLDSFSTFLSDSGYAHATASRHIKRFKFFCERAIAENIEVSKQFKNRVFVKEEDNFYLHPYLSEFEINKIFKHDFSFDKKLDNCRDLFVIGLWTGLRISDFLKRLNVSNFNEEGMIKIKTAKTRTFVQIPVHRHVKAILEKRNGELPKKISESKFNKYVKIICQVVEIDEVMAGAVMDVNEKTKEKRKKFGNYKKYELVTSHICRRSFCTNLMGHVPNKVICDIAGWSDENMMHKYNKTTKLESAMTLQSHWNENQ